jgi:UDP-N-acetylglucosamine 2-epimerase (non-hydrolysing)
MKKIILVAGARPNFMKIAPVLRAVKRYSGSLKALLVHTGQHYNENMSETFFKSLGIKRPDYNLGVGSGSHAVQTASIMVKFEKVCLKEQPDVVVVVGDVNSTIAAGLVTKKLHISLAHIEAGLRSRDLLMPEEINRMATDAIADVFFTTEK